MATVTCSDCPPYYLDPKHPKTYSGLHMSRSWQNGQLGESVFECSRKGIIKTSPGKEDVVVIKAWPKKRFQMDVDFRGVRISPDERYLAYRFHRGLMDIFPGEGGKTHLYLKDLETGKDVRLISMKSFGNMIWSSDSKRLYFSAWSGRARRNAFSLGICFVDVKDVFGAD